jgi:hypothetical protein
MSDSPVSSSTADGMGFFMTKKEFVYDDRAIMESATNLWISAIVFNQELLQVIFDQWNAS